MNQSEVRFEDPGFSDSGIWVKTALHCHSTYSDGAIEPDEVVERHRLKGYGCVSVTDHGAVFSTESLSRKSLIGINGTENGGEPDIVAIGAKRAVESSLPLAERATALAEQGAFTIGAHPPYCRVYPEDYLACKNLMAMEIYNAYRDHTQANGIATELWDMILGRGKRIYGVATDDAHFRNKRDWYSDCGHGWVEIQVADFTAEALLAGLKHGHFFSTQGPRFTEFHVSGSVIEIACTAVKEVRFRSFGSEGYVQRPGSRSDSLTEASLPRGFVPDTYVRIELVDHFGLRAWSNPVFVEREQ